MFFQIFLLNYVIALFVVSKQLLDCFEYETIKEKCFRHNYIYVRWFIFFAETNQKKVVTELQWCVSGNKHTASISQQHRPFLSHFRKYITVVLLIGTHNSETRQWMACPQGFATSSYKSTWGTQLPGQNMRGRPYKRQGHAHIRHFTVNLLVTWDRLVTCPGCIPNSYSLMAAIGSGSPQESY